MSGRNRRLVISARAERDLQHIVQHSLEAWGEEQCDRYAAALDRALETIAANPAIGRQRDDLRPGMRSMVVEQHAIFYRVTTTAVVVVRVLHGRMDAGRAIVGRSG